MFTEWNGGVVERSQVVCMQPDLPDGKLGVGLQADYRHRKALEEFDAARRGLLKCSSQSPGSRCASTRLVGFG